MTTGAQAIRDLARSEADLVQAHAILDCLQRADACPQEWIDEYERLRSAHYAAGQSTYRQLTEAGASMGSPPPLPPLADPSKAPGNSRLAALMLRDRGVPRTTRACFGQKCGHLPSGLMQTMQPGRFGVFTQTHRTRLPSRTLVP